MDDSFNSCPNCNKRIFVDVAFCPHCGLKFETKTENESFSNEDPYLILQISRDAEKEVIDAAYKSLARKYHPDNRVNGSDEKMKKINWAYEKLRDPNYRQNHSPINQGPGRPNTPPKNKSKETSNHSKPDEESSTRSAEFSDEPVWSKSTSNKPPDFKSQNSNQKYTTKKYAYFIVIFGVMIILCIIFDIFRKNITSNNPTNQYPTITVVPSYTKILQKSPAITRIPSTPTIIPTKTYQFTIPNYELGNITNNPAFDGEPDWSPDGSKIVFSSDRDGGKQLYIMNSDGSYVKRLTFSSGDDSVPQWSPDGSMIVFSSFRNGNFDIYRINYDGSNETRLTSNSDMEMNPCWSPDGKKILFVYERVLTIDNMYSTDPDFRNDLFVMDINGTNVINLVSNNIFAFEYPSWSPDGKHIAYLTYHHDYTDIYLMDLSNFQETLITRIVGYSHPSWAPDGKRIVYTSEQKLDAEIYSINIDGTSEKRLTKRSGEDSDPDWSPDGTKIVFQSFQNGNMEIFTMNIDGTMK